MRLTRRLLSECYVALGLARPNSCVPGWSTQVCIYPHTPAADVLTIILFTATGKVITSVSGATAPDVDKAVAAAQKAFDTVWGLKTPGIERARLLNKLADLWEAHLDELAAIEAMDGGALA